tara:strand:+ start:145 stop:471 length:327 start_codon:yes stop_codon:yes gene_type:complete
MKQMFKYVPEYDKIKYYIQQLSDKYSNYNLINEHTFARSKMNGVLTKYIDYLLPCYYRSKQFYLTRDMTYNHFLTIIRQVCKVCNILFTYKIKYISSKYMIEYYIYEL